MELSRREAFFKDPFFADLQGSMRDGLKNQLAEFSARSMGVAGAGLNEAAHNIQVSSTAKLRFGGLILGFDDIVKMECF